MAHFNDADADRQSASTSSRPTPTSSRPTPTSSWPTPTASRPAFTSSWLDPTPGWPTPTASWPNLHSSPTPVPEDTCDYAPEAPTNSRSVHAQRDCTSGSQTDPKPEESSRTSNSNEALTQGDDQIASSKRFWSVSGRCDEATGSNYSTATHTRSTQPPSTLTWNAPVIHQPITGPHRVTRAPWSYRCIPYTVPRVDSTKGSSAGAGPSNVASPRTPSVTMSPTNPPGGLSEATASANITKTATEENAGTSTLRPARKASRESRYNYTHNLETLCDWAQRWAQHPVYPTQREALNIALGFVRTHRQPVYDTPRLRKGSTPIAGDGRHRNDRAKNEVRKRAELREVYLELSRYYQLPKGQGQWKCPELLGNVFRDVGIEHLFIRST